MVRTLTHECSGYSNSLWNQLRNSGCLDEFQCGTWLGSKFDRSWGHFHVSLRDKENYDTSISLAICTNLRERKRWAGDFAIFDPFDADILRFIKKECVTQEVRNDLAENNGVKLTSQWKFVTMTQWHKWVRGGQRRIYKKAWIPRGRDRQGILEGRKICFLTFPPAFCSLQVKPFWETKWI